MTQFLTILLQFIFEILEAGITSFSDLIISLVPHHDPHDYHARFEKPNKLLSKKGHGIYVSNYSSDLESAYMHGIVFGASGSGKSTNIAFPILLQNCNFSYVVLDPFSELFNGTAAYLKSIGYDVLTLDYSNAIFSEGFNVLALCKSETDVYSIAHTLIMNAQEGSQYDYWSQSAEQVLQFFMWLTIQTEPLETRHMKTVVERIQIFSYAPSQVDEIVLSTNNELIIRQYKAIVATPEKTLQSTLSTLRVALRVFDIPSIKEITQNNTIIFEEFFNKKTVLFITNSSDSVFASFNATFFEAFFAYIIKRPVYQFKVPVMFIMDECATMKISLSQALSQVRKAGVSILTFWQDFDQIEQVHGKNEASVIYANSYLKVFLPSNRSLATCTMLEKILGKYTYLDEEKKQKKTRELMTVTEIRELKKILVLLGVEKPMLIEPVPFYVDEALLAKSKMPILKREKKNRTETATKNSNEKQNERTTP